MSKINNIVCYCNRVSDERIQSVIDAGATSLSQIYDQCGAGVGPCGGACRVRLLDMLHVKQPNQTQSAVKTESTPEVLIQAISLFNRRYYWECHEVLEEAWLEEHGKRKLFYQAIIQASAALYHALNANPQGVIRLAEESLKKLQNFRPQYLEVPLEVLCIKLEFFINNAKEILGQTATGFDYKQLPYLTIGSNMDPAENRQA